MNNKSTVRMLAELHSQTRYQQYIDLPVVCDPGTFSNENGRHLAGRQGVDVVHANSGPMVPGAGHLDQCSMGSGNSQLICNDFSTCRSTGENVELEGQT